MKKIRVLLIVLSFSSIACFGQSDSVALSSIDSLAPYQKTSFLPNFSIVLADSTWFGKKDIEPNKPTLILYFSPDCGHCQLETEELLTKMDVLKNLQIIMITSKSYERMKNFADYYKLSRFPTIKVGSDTARLITQFYAVKNTPFSALYDKEGKLMTVYLKGINMDEMIKLVRE